MLPTLKELKPFDSEEELPSMIYLADYFCQQVKDTNDTKILSTKVPELIKNSFYATQTRYPQDLIREFFAYDIEDGDEEYNNRLNKMIINLKVAILASPINQ